MTTRLRLFVGWLSVCGGALGAIIVFFALFQTGKLAPLAAVTFLLGLTLFTFGAYAGWATVKELPGWPICIQVFWLLQVPLFSLSWVSYFSSAAAGAWLWATTEPRAGASFNLGSQLQLSVGHPGPFEPYPAFGVNVVALVVVFVIFRALRHREP